MREKLYINGVWQAGSGEMLLSLNPATREMLWQGASAAASDVDMAMQAAAYAFLDWGRRLPQERIAIVNAYREVIAKRATEIAEIIAKETGKVLWDAKSEVQAMIGKIAISITAYNERTGEKINEANGSIAHLRHRPHGVVGVYGPYNFPGHLPNGHIVPALIAGNTVVFKPSDYTPLVAEVMVSAWEEAGLPAGVLNLVQGGRDTGIALAAHPLINGIYFTGSAEVGALLHKQFGGRPEVMLALEMGGNNPLIVHEVNDKKAAAILTLQSAFVSTGQRCTCARRLIVPEGKEGNDFVAQLCMLASSMRIGAYNEEPQPFMGPLIGEREGKQLLNAQQNLLSQGAVALLPLDVRQDNSAFVTPAILDVTQVENRPDKEYFGPFLQVIRVKDMDHAIAEANDTRYGLSAGLFSDSKIVYERFITDIRAGVVAWNRPTTGASSALPFGGIGVSGNHRPSAYYAADYCAYPVAAQEMDKVVVDTLPPGIIL